MYTQYEYNGPIKYTSPAKAILFTEPTKSNLEKVREFQVAFNSPNAQKITVLDEARTQLRMNLIREEVKELEAEFYRSPWEPSKSSALEPVPADELDIPNIAKEMADILYVVYGFAIEMGIPLDDVFAEVHRSNMSKLGEDGKPVYRADGKVLKGENYSPADIATVLIGRY